MHRLKTTNPVFFGDILAVNERIKSLKVNMFIFKLTVRILCYYVNAGTRKKHKAEIMLLQCFKSFIDTNSCNKNLLISSPANTAVFTSKSGEATRVLSFVFLVH